MDKFLMKEVESKALAVLRDMYEERLLERGVEDYLALRYADDPIEAFNLFIKAWVPPNYHAHLLDSDENDGQFVRDHIAKAIEVRTDL